MNSPNSGQSSVKPLRRVLIFSHISERDGAKLLKILAETLQLRKINFRKVIITTYDERANCVDDIGKLDFVCLSALFSDEYPDRCFQPPTIPNGMKESLIETWHSVFPDIPAVFEPTIEEAIDAARTYCGPDGGQILITGSLCLVGGALRILEPETAP